jgi:signal transduction histidine kinase
VIALVVTAIGVAAAYGEAHPSVNYFTAPNHLPHTPDAALLLVAAAGVVLAWRQRCPRFVTAASTALVVAYTLPGYENGAAVLLPALALWTLAALTPLRQAVAWAVAVTAVLMVATGFGNPFGPFGGGFFLIPANDAVGLFAGIAVASRRAYVESVRVRAAQDAAQQAQRRVEEERLRIARELHDVVAHTMATITVQAAAATQLLRDRPEQAAESLKSIRAASKDGLRELRTILDVLRTAADDADEAAGPGVGEAADPTQPTPGLGRLDALVAGVRAAGLPVTVTVTGQPRDLPAVTDLSAFRIIQEALTNTLRHAGPATAAVTLDYAGDSLLVEVRDTGNADPSDSAAPSSHGLGVRDSSVPSGHGLGVRDSSVPSGHGLGGVRDSAATSGHGLSGIRERAAAAGGTVDIGPLPEGGFRVAARLPLDWSHAPEPAEGTQSGGDIQSAGGTQSADATQAPDAAQSADAAQAPDAAQSADAAQAPDAAQSADAAQAPDAIQSADAARATDVAQAGHAAQPADGARTALGTERAAQ